MKRFDLAVIVAAAALVAGGGGFALGRLTAPKAAATSSQNSDGSNGQFGSGQGGGGFRRGGLGTRGAVSSVSGNTITITASDGSAKTVNVSSSTGYMDGSTRNSSSLSAIQSGTTIMAMGQTASDGSITATRIIINPPQPGSGGGGFSQPQSN